MKKLNDTVSIDRRENYDQRKTETNKNRLARNAGFIKSQARIANFCSEIGRTTAKDINVDEFVKCTKKQ